MKQDVFFRKCDGYSEIAVTIDGVLDRFNRLNDGFLTGAVFRGKITRVLKQVGAFVDIGLEKEGLLPYLETYKTGDFVTVQVMKEPTDTKGCALKDEITVPGRFVVLNDRKEMRFSKNLSEETKQKVSTLQTDERVGFIFRTSCEYADLGEISAECVLLAKQYDSFMKDAENSYEIKCLFADTAENVARRTAMSDDALFTDFTPIEKQIRELGARKIEKDGVELVFDKTEAMTVVDVNFHKYGKTFGNADQTAYQANVIALGELARQLRLRNVGGIIVVDFISFHNKEYLTKLKDLLVSELKKDALRTSVELVKEAGLFVIVRKIRYSSL